MIKQFDDNSYIEIKKHDGKILISIAGQDADNPRSVTVNAAEVTVDEFNLLISDIIKIDSVKSEGPTKKKTTKKKTTKSSKDIKLSD